MKKITLSILILCAFLPFFVSAQKKEYVPLVPIPGVTEGKAVDLGNYLGSLYKLLISVTVILSVIVITIAGIQQMTSESPFGKSEAKKRIGGAIGGIILAVSSWFILNLINPDLVKFKFLSAPTQSTSGLSQIKQISASKFPTLLKDQTGKYCFDHRTIGTTNYTVDCYTSFETCTEQMNFLKNNPKSIQEVTFACYFVIP